MDTDPVESFRRQTAARVATRKADLVRWLEQYSPTDQIEARLAMLELALEALIEIHGEFDATEIAMSALRKASITDGKLQ